MFTSYTPFSSAAIPLPDGNRMMFVSGMCLFHQQNWCMVLPCGYRGISSPLPSPNAPTSTTSHPGWKSTLGSLAPTSIPACYAFHVHFQELGHRLACLSTAGCFPGSPPSPVCRPMHGSPHGRQDLHHRSPGHCEDNLHWPPEAGVRSPYWHRIRFTTVHSLVLTTRSGRRVRFPDCLGLQRSRRGWCGGHRGLDHPRSQDGLLPIRHLLIDTDRFASEVATWIVQSVYVWRGVSAASKRPAIQCARRKVVLTCECVLCVEFYNPNHSRNHKFSG